MEGAKHPKHEGKICYGVDLRSTYMDMSRGINLEYLMDAYKNFPYKHKFFLKNRFFDKLAGSDKLRKQIEAGMSPKQIKSSWEKGLNEFKRIRENYLIYN
jgi:uncharacterized protein YbbC (DUF1343 family)